MAIKTIGLALIGNKIYPVNTSGNEKEENMPKSNHYNQYPFLTDGLTDSDEISNDINDVRIISNINSGSTSSEDEGEQNSNDHSYIDNNEYEDNSSKFGYYLEELDYDELELIMKKILACENDSSDENLEYSDDETETEDEDIGK
nr:4134_t:CDS:2 [Entrophospora candida]